MTLGICDKCSYKSTIGDKFTCGWGGFVYCSKCIEIADKEFKEKSAERKKNQDQESKKDKKAKK